MEVLMRVTNKTGQYQGRELVDPYSPFFSKRYDARGGFRGKNIANALYNMAYDELISQDIPKNEFDQAMQDLLITDPRFDDICILAMDPLWVVKQRERCEFNYFQRLSRFRKKAFMGNFNYLATFTYDSTKMSLEGFRKGLKKSLENMTYRYGWRYMGVPEEGEKGGRLHFHFLIRVPEADGFPGKNYARRQYSSKRHKWEVITSNTYFDQYGINDFSAISRERQDYVHAINYVCKYLAKTKARVIYSRNLSDSEIRVVDTKKDVMMARMSFGKVYILYDSLFIGSSISEDDSWEDPIDVSSPDWYEEPPILLKSFVARMEYQSQKIKAAA